MIYGRIWYRDIFKQCHSAGFILRIVGPTAGIICDECKSIIATLHGPRAHRAGVRTDRIEKAQAMPGQEIDRLSDPLVTEEERQRRKRRLLKGQIAIPRWPPPIPRAAIP